jgi:hypothetical protein
MLYISLSHCFRCVNVILTLLNFFLNEVCELTEDLTIERICFRNVESDVCMDFISR